MAKRNLVFGACLFLMSLAGAKGASLGAGAANPSSVPAGVATPVTFTVIITDPSVIASSVNLQQVNNLGQATVVGTMYDDGTHGDAIAGDQVYSLQLSVFQQSAGAIIYRASAGFLGSLLRPFSAPISLNVTGTGVAISISSPPLGAYLNITPTVVTGVVADPSATVTVNGVTAQVTGNSFSASIPLQEGSNRLTAVAQNSGVTTTASETVTLDTTPPHVTINTPGSASITTDASVDVSGIVNDIVVGTVNPLQATVTVNGISAQVSNRTYLAPNIPLQAGVNTITATARDRAGNFASTSVTITRQTSAQSALRIISGNNLSGPIKSLLAAPLVVQALNEAGQPIPNTPVVFQVTGGDGTLTAGNPPGMASMAVNTNAQGRAQVNYTLGSRAGAGNNIVLASATGITATPTFSESATSTPAAMIVVDSGGNQNGAVGQALPLPFIAIVTDAGYNRLANVQVSFTVTQGGGSIGGQNAVIATSDSDGRVQAVLTLGPQAGINNNIVTANFAGNAGMPAAFTATSFLLGPAANTTISGVVLDNSNNPIPGVTMRLYQINSGSSSNIPQQVLPAVQTNATGYFSIPSAPVGVYKLMADGTTVVGGGPFPTLEYDITTVAGQNNTVGSPIYLPQLNVSSQLCVSPTMGGTLTLPQAPGFALTIAAGSVTFPGGSRTGCVSVSPVNMDKVPMVPGFGQQPRFIVTIQPVGAMFNPPAQMTIPNVDGLLPRTVTEMYSYDHDLASFVAIGTGTVSADGSVIASDPGVGVIKAGWHCGGNPNSSGSAGTCPTCQKCSGSTCMPDNTQHPPGFCMMCVNGTATQTDPGSWKNDSSYGASAALPDILKNALQSGINSIPGVSLTVQEVKLGVMGKVKDCCSPATGATVTNGKTEGTVNIQATIPTANIQIFPLPPTAIDKTWDVTVLGEIVSVRIVFLAGVFITSSIVVGAEGGIRTDSCGEENCAFGGLTGDVTAGLNVQASAQGCFDSTLTEQYCSPTIDVSFTPIAVSLQGRVGYNQAKCDAGLSGFLKLANIKLSLEFKLPLLPALSYEYEIYGGACLLGSCGV